MVKADGTAEQHTSGLQDTARVALGTMLVCAGTSHLTVARRPFYAQVPPWVPMNADAVVVESGVVEIALGTALLLLPRRKRLLGRIAASLFVAIFPGNVAQYRWRRSAFGLDTDEKRLARLFLQVPLVAWALWSTGALARRDQT